MQIACQRQMHGMSRDGAQSTARLPRSESSQAACAFPICGSSANACCSAAARLAVPAISAALPGPASGAAITGGELPYLNALPRSGTLLKYANSW